MLAILAAVLLSSAAAMEPDAQSLVGLVLN